MLDGIKDVEDAIREVDRLQAVANRTRDQLDDWQGWQQRILRLEDNLKASAALYKKLCELEQNGTLMRSEILSHVAEQQARAAAGKPKSPALAAVVDSALAQRQDTLARLRTNDDTPAQQAS